jgi:hypothetical protein
MEGGEKPQGILPLPKAALLLAISASIEYTPTAPRPKSEW